MTAVSDPRLLALSGPPEAREASRAHELWRRAPIGFAATIVNALILVSIFHGAVSPRALWGWLAAIASITAVRYVQWLQFQRKSAKSKIDPWRWQRYFTLGIGASGVVWGSTAFVFFPHSIPHQTFLAFVLGGMVAGASATFSAQMPAFAAFILPALLPLSFRFFLEGDSLHVAMGAMMLLFGVLLSATAYRVHVVTAKWHESREQLGQAHSSLSSKAERAEALSRELSEVREALSAQDRDLGERVVKYMVEVTDILTTLKDTASEPIELQQRAALRRSKNASLTTFAQGLIEQAGRPIDRIGIALEKVWRNPERYPSLASLTRTLVQIENANDELGELFGELERYVDTSAGTLVPVDLTTLARDVTARWLRESGYRGQLWTAYSDAPPVEAEPLLVGRALSNLLTNASEAVTQEDGLIEVTTRLVAAEEIDAGSVFLPAPARAKRYVALCVSDNGVGMPAEILEQAFDPFFTTKVATTGFRRGLGLTDVMAAMRRHGGQVTIASRLREGTTVQLLFPLESPP